MLGSFPPQEKIPFPQPSSNFCLESGLSKGLTAVWWVPLGWCIASDVCPDWLPQPWNLLSAFCQSPTLHALSFYEVHSRLDWRKVGRGGLTLGHGKNAAISLDQSNQRSAAHLRSWKLALCSEAFKPSWESGIHGGSSGLKASVCSEGWPDICYSSHRKWTCYLYQCKQVLAHFPSFQEDCALLACVANSLLYVHALITVDYKTPNIFKVLWANLWRWTVCSVHSWN